MELENKEFSKILEKLGKEEPAGTKRDKDGKLVKKCPAKERAKAQHWFGTAWHEPEWDPLHMQYMVFQQEIGRDQQKLMQEDEDYTPIIHWQFFITMKEMCPWKLVMDCMEGNASRLWNCSRAYMPCKAANYCRKVDDTALPGTQQEFGKDILDYETEGEDKQESKMKRLAKVIRSGEEVPDEDILRYHRGIAAFKGEIAEKTAPKYRKVRCTVIWGDPRSGKDSLAEDTAELAGERCYRLPPVEEKEKVWFDNYDGEENLIISDFYGQISIPRLLRFLDGHKLKVEVKNGFTAARWTKVWITSNAPPDSWWPGKTGTPQYEALFIDRINEVIHMETDEGMKASLDKVVYIDAGKEPEKMKKYKDALDIAKKRRIERLRLDDQVQPQNNFAE